jgi:hypothetical protein
VIEHPVGQANAPMTAVTILPSDPPVIAATNQPTAPSSSPDPAAAEPVQAEESPAPVIEHPGHASAGRPPTPETIGPVELAELLARARQQMKALALTTPAGDNALETLQRVLAAMPSQPDALQGIHDIASKYAELAAQAKRRGEHDLAKRYVNKGLHVVPDHPDLLALQQKL